MISDSEIVNMYSSGLSTYRISANTGIPKSTVLKRLRKIGTKMRDLSDRVRRLHFNHAFFSRFSVETCYWAGMLAADGNISATQHPKISLGLKNSDIGHLEKFSKALEFDGRIYRYDRQSSIVLTSDYMAYDLWKMFGIGPKKSLTIQPPDRMPVEFAAHFIRGYIDGDGSFLRTRPQLAILGTESMMTWMRNILIPIGGKEPSVCRKNKIFTVTFGGKFQVVKIAEWLYADSSEAIRLDRKFEIARKYIDVARIESGKMTTCSWR